MKTAREITVDQIAARIPAHKAQLAVVRALAAAGAEMEWDSQTIENVLNELNICLDDMGVDDDIPSVYDQDDNAVAFWSHVSG